MFRLTLMICIINSITTLDGARILAVFPIPSISHQVVFRPLTKELAKRGHEVTVITTDPAFPTNQAPENLTEIDVHDISYGFLREYIAETVTEYIVGEENQWITIFKTIAKFFTVLEIQIKSEQVQKLIRENKQFDLLLTEAYVRPAVVFSHIFKSPVIQVSSFGAVLDDLNTVGASIHPLLYPIPFSQHLNNLSAWDKLKECYQVMHMISYQKSNDQAYNKMLQGLFGPEVPPVDELIKNVDMLFLNVHPIWMNNQPMPPNVVFMGGLHQKPEKELPQELKSYLDASKNGVVYVSFGTNIQPMMFTPERLNVITEALSELPYDVLLKWNDDELPGRTKNIKLSKWLPQSDLLRHPNVKAFLTQGGLQSTDEAITAGVPLVCIPMLGDQWYNAEKYVQFKIGIKLQYLTVSKLELKNALENVITNKSYRENIVKLREKMYDQPQTPLERAIWWTEHVIRHGGARHLRSPAANMSWREYYELDLVIIALSCLIISLAILSFVSITLWRFVVTRFVKNYKLKKS